MYVWHHKEKQMFPVSRVNVLKLGMADKCVCVCVCRGLQRGSADWAAGEARWVRGWGPWRERKMKMQSGNGGAIFNRRWKRGNVDAGVKGGD